MFKSFFLFFSSSVYTLHGPSLRSSSYTVQCVPLSGPSNTWCTVSITISNSNHMSEYGQNSQYTQQKYEIELIPII